jgi:membrane protein involved in colicin uptake
MKADKEAAEIARIRELEKERLAALEKARLDQIKYDEKVAELKSQFELKERIFAANELKAKLEF